MIPLPEQFTCAERELAKRRRLYPKFVATGKVTQEKANYEIECMTAVVASLRKLVMLAEVSEEMKVNERNRTAKGQEQTAAQPELPQAQPARKVNGAARLAEWLAQKNPSGP